MGRQPKMEDYLFDNLQLFFNFIGVYAELILTNLSSQSLVVCFTGLIIFVFLKYYAQMLKNTSAALKDISKLRVILEKAIGRSSIKTVQERDESQQQLRKNRNDADFIRLIEQTGMINWWEQINLNFTFEIGGNKVYTTTDFINSFFTFEKFIATYASRGVVAAPSVLTGLGIIGTFLGLSIGVGSASAGLASPDISVARNAMSQLLEGAQLAFITSLLGLFFALVMRITFNARSERIRVQVADFNNLLSTVATPRDSGISGLKALNDIKENTQFLSNEIKGFKAK